MRKLSGKAVQFIRAQKHEMPLPTAFNTFRGGSRILVTGAQHSFDPKGGGLSPKIAQNRVFPLNVPEKCMIKKKKILGARGGPGPQAPLDPLLTLSLFSPFLLKKGIVMKENKRKITEHNPHLLKAGPEGLGVADVLEAIFGCAHFQGEICFGGDTHQLTCKTSFVIVSQVSAAPVPLNLYGTHCIYSVIS